MDGPLARLFSTVVEISIALLVKFAAVIIITPVFIAPGILVFALGVWLGRLYMRAQLAVKREMANARSPVLGQYEFGFVF